MPKNKPPNLNLNKEALANELIKLSDEDLLDVLELVFEVKTPYPTEQRYFKNHFFLGVATSSLVGKAVWTDWTLSAVSYPDKDRYPDGVEGPGFSQFSECLKCKTALCSNGKQAFCSVCGHLSYLS